MKKILKTLALSTIIMLLLPSLLVIQPVAASLPPPVPGWETWQNWKTVTFTETAGISRTDEPVDISVTFDTSTPVDDIRVLDPALSEIPSQVYNAVPSPLLATSANVAFLVNVPASSSVTYTILYNNQTACPPPVYDGLRLYTVAPGDTYNITALQTGVESNYFHIFWKNMFDLYSQGQLVVWGNAFWGLGQVNIATMWNDAFGNTWFGTGKSLAVVNSGPIFVDLNYTEAFASDFWGTIFDFNVTSNKMLRIYYQPNLEPLVRYRQTFHIVTNLANYTISGLNYMTFRVRNSTGGWIYEDLTWEDIFGVKHSSLAGHYGGWGIIDDLHNQTYPNGWWMYNGTSTAPGQTDSPHEYIGMIPKSSGGDILGADYTVWFWHTAPGGQTNDQWFKGTYNGVNSNTIWTWGYIITYKPPPENIAPFMQEKKTKLCNPLTYSISGELPIEGVGGAINPLDTLALMAPWIILATALTVAAVSFVFYRKHRLTKTL